MSTKVPVFSGSSQEAKLPSGRGAKASLVGAKTVKGPGELKVSTKSSATTAATQVLKITTDWVSSNASSTSSMMSATALVLHGRCALGRRPGYPPAQPPRTALDQELGALNGHHLLGSFQVCGQDLLIDHMENQDVHKVLMALWLQQGGQGAFWQGSECSISRLRDHPSSCR